MNTLRLSLASTYDSTPPDCEIFFCGESLFRGKITDETNLEYTVGDFESFDLKIVKTGKTLALVKNKESQVLNVVGVNLNGIDLKIKAFGQFHTRSNPYVEDSISQTDELHLNGIWTLNLPERTIMGDTSSRPDETKFRNTMQDCDIACFGCSQTWGSFLSDNETWPSRLQENANRSVMNYGVRGSNINEITSLVDYYLENYKTDTILIYLPHSMRRTIKINGEWKRISLYDDLTRDLILHGEEHSIASISGKLCNWLENISSKKRVYLSTYHGSEYELMRQTGLKKYMMPFLESDSYPKASDGEHHGPEFNQDLAKTFAKFLNIG